MGMTTVEMVIGPCCPQGVGPVQCLYASTEL